MKSKFTLLLILIITQISGCDRTEYLDEETAESMESSQSSNPEKNLPELSSLVELNSPCRISQTSLVAYDMELKALMFCDGNKWTSIESAKNLVNTEGTNTSKYKLLGKLVSLLFLFSSTFFLPSDATK